MKASLSIRVLTPADIPACAGIVAATDLWRDHYQVTPARAEQWFREAWQAGHSLLVATEEQQVVGFVWFLPRGTFQRSGYIRLIGVAGPARRRGIGAALLQAAEREIFAQSEHVFLLVSHFNQPAQAFYRRMGYEQVGAIPDYVVPGITEYIFYKQRSSLPRHDNEQ